MNHLLSSLLPVMAAMALGAAAPAPPEPEAHPAVATLLRCRVGPDLAAADCQLLSAFPPTPEYDEALREIGDHPLRLGGLKPGDETEVLVRLHYDWPVRDLLDSARPARLFTVQQRIWLAAPPANITTAYYPERAQRLGVAGEADIRCRIDTTGLLNPCWVLADTNPDFWFGPAALKISKLYRMSQTTTDGLATAGGEYQLHFIFRVPR